MKELSIETLANGPPRHPPPPPRAANEPTIEFSVYLDASQKAAPSQAPCAPAVKAVEEPQAEDKPAEPDEKRRKEPTPLAGGPFYGPMQPEPQANAASPGATAAEPSAQALAALGPDIQATSPFGLAAGEGAVPAAETTPVKAVPLEVACEPPEAALPETQVLHVKLPSPGGGEAGLDLAKTKPQPTAAPAFIPPQPPDGPPPTLHRTPETPDGFNPAPRGVQDPAVPSPPQAKAEVNAPQAAGSPAAGAAAATADREAETSRAAAIQARRVHLDGESAQPGLRTLTGENAANAAAARWSQPPASSLERGALLNGSSPAEQTIFQGLEYALQTGKNSLRLHLSPEELGGIDLRITHKANGAVVTLKADLLSTSALLEHNLPELRQSIQQAGIQLSDLLVGDGEAHNPSGFMGQPSQHNKNAPKRQATGPNQAAEQAAAGLGDALIDFLI